MKFGTVTQNLSVNCIAVKKFKLKNPRRRTVAILKTNVATFHDDSERVCQAYRLSAILDF